MRCSVTNYFLVNLSIADLLVTLICMPMAVGQNVSKLWIYGEVMCMLTTYFQGKQTREGYSSNRNAGDEKSRWAFTSKGAPREIHSRIRTNEMSKNIAFIKNKKVH